jgi:hypothetical protein
MDGQKWGSIRKDAHANFDLKRDTFRRLGV